MRHVLSVLVENEPGVLSRVAGLFSGRGFNIESLNVAPTLDRGVSLMTISTRGDEQVKEQIVKQLRKLVTVIKVVDFEGLATVEREMVIVSQATTSLGRKDKHLALRGQELLGFRLEGGVHGLFQAAPTAV